MDPTEPLIIFLLLVLISVAVPIMTIRAVKDALLRNKLKQTLKDYIKLLPQDTVLGSPIRDVVDACKDTNYLPPALLEAYRLLVKGYIDGHGDTLNDLATPSSTSETPPTVRESKTK